MIETTIHPTAIIEDGAELDSGVVVGPYCVIGGKVKIGKGSRLLSHVVIQGDTSLGEGNELFPFACIGTVPQDLKFSGEESFLTIGDNNKIRESVTIQPGTEHGGLRTSVGSRNLFMANAHVGHDCQIGSDSVFANSVAVAGHVTIEDHVIVGGMAGIHQFCRIGTLAFIAAGSMVSLDVPPYCMAQGDRAHLKGLNVVGLRRFNFSKEEITLIKKMHMHFCMQTGSIESKMSNASPEFSKTPLGLSFLTFLKGSSRGVTTSFRGPGASKNYGDE